MNCCPKHTSKMHVFSFTLSSDLLKDITSYHKPHSEHTGGGGKIF